VPEVQGDGVVERSSTVSAGTRVWFSTSAGMAVGGGSLAGAVAVAGTDLVPVTDAVLDAAIAALGCRPSPPGWRPSWRARLSPGERVLVLGAGGAVGQASLGAAGTSTSSSDAVPPRC
jgi:NADPH:quinone reductase-like Zn-dependent oxidoreductase